MELDVARVLGAVVRVVPLSRGSVTHRSGISQSVCPAALVRVVPLVGRQQQLHQRVRGVGVGQRGVVGGSEGDAGHSL